jgi:hypothetical protein
MTHHARQNLRNVFLCILKRVSCAPWVRANRITADDFYNAALMSFSAVISAGISLTHQALTANQ